ncbi:MAG: hypothetical protein ABI992_09450 [Chthoniobacterales bacterium]
MIKTSPLLALLGFLFFFAADANAQTPTPATNPLAACLPRGIQLSQTAETAIISGMNGASDRRQPVTVEEKLRLLGATCAAENKLIDSHGRSIVFFHLQGCWGNPPPDYREILGQQRRQLETLRASNSVIEITCNPSGAQIP